MLTLRAKVHVEALPGRSILTLDESPPSIRSRAPPRQPSLILFSLGEERFAGTNMFHQLI
jgi:hypothetical protein